MATIRSTGAIPVDLIATLTRLPRLQKQLREMSQDVSIGIPEAVSEALEKANEAFDLATATVAQTFLTAEYSPALPNSRKIGVGTGLALNDAGAGDLLTVQLHAFLASLSLLTGNGMVAKTASGAELRTIQAGSSRIEVMNGDGTGGNPSIDIDEPSLDVGSMGGTLGVDHGGTGVTVLSAFSAHNNGVDQSIPSSGVFTQVALSTAEFDLIGDFFAGAWTPPAGRPISLVGAVRMTMTGVGNVGVAVFKNGLIFRRGALFSGLGDVVANVSCIDMPSGADVYTLRVAQDSGVSQNTFGAMAGTFFQGSML